MRPTFSILLPTRGRLGLLRQAIETVRRQSFADWEIVVSDNASTEDVAGHVRGIGDSRIRCLVQPTAIPVTDNWNRAIDASTGDWILMLGDDDGLMPGSLERFVTLIAKHRPDAVYANAWLLAYPGVLAEAPDGSVKPYGQPALFAGRTEPYILSTEDAQSLVRKSARFEMAFTFNMQHCLLYRPLVERLTIGRRFFHSPYPDFYAMNAVFLEAERLLVCPERLVVIGLSPQSFGAYYFNRREQAGVAFLGNEPSTEDAEDVAHVILPGSPDRTSWLLAMEAVRRHFAAGRDLRVDRDRYRRLVLLSAFGAGRGAVTDAELRGELLARLNTFERFVLVPLIRISVAGASLIPPRLRIRLRRAAHRVLVRSPIVDLGTGRAARDMLDLFERAGEFRA